MYNVYTPKEYLAFEEAKQSPHIAVDDYLLSPEGASVNDICRYIEDCQNSSCKLFHPHWAVKKCIHFAQGRCN
jgi:hypothetical protein